MVYSPYNINIAMSIALLLRTNLVKCYVVQFIFVHHFYLRLFPFDIIQLETKVVDILWWLILKFTYSIRESTHILFNKQTFAAVFRRG